MVLTVVVVVVGGVGAFFNLFVIVAVFSDSFRWWSFHSVQL